MRKYMLALALLTTTANFTYAQAPNVGQTAEPNTELSNKKHNLKYQVDVRTNLLYDALMIKTLGAEWHIGYGISVKLDGSFSYWDNPENKVQKLWILSPEVRWYTTWVDNLYIGIGGNYSRYNIYRLAVGSMFSRNTGYQGSLWSAGITVGYVLPLYEGLALDFNLGLGYVNSNYDSFNILDGRRVYKDRDRSKSLWGPTQLGVSLIWRFMK